MLLLRYILTVEFARFRYPKVRMSSRPFVNSGAVKPISPSRLNIFVYTFI